ncbi:MAG: ABC transporter permease, partial [Lewinella sp.]|nr:ABC transporter permease [Lewinella sp.]
KLRIFSMIVLETIMLALVALLPGLLIGWLTVSYFNRTGIDLSAFSAGMQQFGMSSVVYTDLHPEIYLQLAGAVGLTAVIGALYPAVKAVRLKPVEAMRKV